MKHLFGIRLFILLFVIVAVGLLPVNSLLGQERDTKIRLAFYNLENFFDTKIDSARSYNDFTPEGAQGWTLSRYFQKRANLFKTILAMGEGSPPDVLGVCEVENEDVMLDLVMATPLKRFNYRIVHFESDDRRGIDVGLIYRLEHLSLINSRAIKLSDPSDTTFVTRDILYVSFEAGSVDTLHVFINHWPSRYGGVLASDAKRSLAARVLRSHVDSLNQVLKNPKIVIMGDFNDTPDDISINKVLRASSPEKQEYSSDLIHLFTNPDLLGFQGTIKHMQNWQIFDHIIISRALFDSSDRLVFVQDSQRIFAADFLMTEDDRHLGRMLYRTYQGPKYIGGFSDHLPVMIDLKLQKR